MFIQYDAPAKGHNVGLRSARGMNVSTYTVMKKCRLTKLAARMFFMLECQLSIQICLWRTSELLIYIFPAKLVRLSMPNVLFRGLMTADRESGRESQPSLTNDSSIGCLGSKVIN